VAEANGLPTFFHVASGGVDSKAGTSCTGSQVKGILGGNLAKIVGFDTSKKLAPVNPPASPKVPAPA